MYVPANTLNKSRQLKNPEKSGKLTLYAFFRTLETGSIFFNLICSSKPMKQIPTIEKSKKIRKNLENLPYMHFSKHWKLVQYSLISYVLVNQSHKFQQLKNPKKFGKIRKTYLICIFQNA